MNCQKARNMLGGAESLLWAWRKFAVLYELQRHASLVISLSSLVYKTAKVVCRQVLYDHRQQDL